MLSSWMALSFSASFWTTDSVFSNPKDALWTLNDFVSSSNLSWSLSASVFSGFSTVEIPRSLIFLTFSTIFLNPKVALWTVNDLASSSSLSYNFSASDFSPDSFFSNKGKALGNFNFSLWSGSEIVSSSFLSSSSSLESLDLLLSDFFTFFPFLVFF